MSANCTGFGYDSHKYTSQRLLIITASTAVGSVIILIAASYFCEHFCRRRRHRDAARIAAMTQQQDHSEGLDPSTMVNLPTFKYKRHEINGGTDRFRCSICLNMVQEDEEVRRLPACKHMFHQECDDLWFYAHSTCPLCRSAVLETVEEV